MFAHCSNTLWHYLSHRLCSTDRSWFTLPVTCSLYCVLIPPCLWRIMRMGQVAIQIWHHSLNFLDRPCILMYLIHMSYLRSQYIVCIFVLYLIIQIHRTKEINKYILSFSIPWYHTWLFATLVVIWICEPLVLFICYLAHNEFFTYFVVSLFSTLYF